MIKRNQIIVVPVDVPRWRRRWLGYRLGVGELSTRAWTERGARRMVARRLRFKR